MREQNYSIGQQAEQRMCTLLKELGATEIVQGNHNAIPDVSFTLFTKTWCAELKSVLFLHSSSRIGVAKISRTEFDGMNALSGEKCIIIELRHQGSRSHNYIWIPYGSISELFASNSAMASMTISWILNHGVNLAAWFLSESLDMDLTSVLVNGG